LQRRLSGGCLKRGDILPFFRQPLFIFSRQVQNTTMKVKSMDHKMNLYLVRHGETYLNRYGKMQGWADSPLTEEGKEMAIQFGKSLAAVPFSRVYTSDLGRTVETAQLILQQNDDHTHLEINQRKEFRESFFGSFEGEYLDATWIHIAQELNLPYQTLPDIFRNYSLEEVMDFIKKSDPFHHAESYDEIWERVEKGLSEIVSKVQRNDENILLVAHGVIIRMILSKFSDEFHSEVEIKNCSVSVVQYSSNLFKVVSMNQ
jgi:broad specificity phosphatase PhoE